MGKRHAVALSVAAAALAAFVLPAQAGSVSTVSRETRATASGAAATKTVSITDDQFSPKTVKVKKGSKVKWVNNGDDDHTTTGSGWDKTLAPGQSYARKFKKAGTFKYVCRFHGGMTGKVKVTS